MSFEKLQRYDTDWESVHTHAPKPPVAAHAYARPTPRAHTRQIWTYVPFVITSICIFMLSCALWVKETHTWVLSRCILLVLIWAYTSFTRHYRSKSTTYNINHDHASAVITWAAWLVYSSVVELTPDTFPVALGIAMSVLSVACVLVSIHVENERHSKKDGLRRSDWIVLQITRGLFVGLLFIPHRSTLFSLGALHTAGVSMLFFLNFAIASMSTDIDQSASLYSDCKLMQSVWVLVGDIRVTAIVLPYVLFRLNKIRWLTTGDGWKQEPAERHDTPKHLPQYAPPPAVAAAVSATNVLLTEVRVEPVRAHESQETDTVVRAQLDDALKRAHAPAKQQPTTAPKVDLFNSSSEHMTSRTQRAALVSQLQLLSKQSSRT